MDKNKLEKLREVGYSIPKTCGLCRHGVFPSDDWGICSIQTYEHLKHSGSPRQLSIHRGGSCEQFEADETLIKSLGSYSEFVK